MRRTALKHVLYYHMFPEMEQDMTGPRLDDPDFWSAASQYQRVAHPFTTDFARRALAEAALPPTSHVLDIAAGAGSLAIVAAEAGHRVLAVDFSPGMVARVAALDRPDLEAREMNGEALDLPDAAFDAAFSMFGIVLFADWRVGMREMARVVRPGGVGVIATWPHPGGAAVNLLLHETCARLFPDLDPGPPIAGLHANRDPARLAAVMEEVGFASVEVVAHTHDFLLEPDMLEGADPMFAFSPLWPKLDDAARAAVLADIRAQAGGRTLPIPSTALIAIARRARG